MAKSKLKSNAEKVPSKEKDELRICFRVRFFDIKKNHAIVAWFGKG